MNPDPEFTSSSSSPYQTSPNDDQRSTDRAGRDPGGNISDEAESDTHVARGAGLRRAQRVLPRVRTFTAIVLAVILLITIWLRVFGPTGHSFDWGNGQFQHPDEWFVGGTLVQNIQYPSSPLDFFNSDSGWNPAVAAAVGRAPVDGHPAHDQSGFNYGSLPIYLIKIFGSILSWLAGKWTACAVWKTANPILYGRVLSGIFDTCTVLLVYLLGKRLAGSRAGLLAASFACFAVLSIQLAHFTTVDSFLGTFATGTLLASVALVQDGRKRDYVFASIWLGAALATKASAVTLVATVGLAVLWRELSVSTILAEAKRTASWPLAIAAAALRKRTWGVLKLLVWDYLVLALLPVACMTAVALFVFQPYTFTDFSNFKAGVLYQNDLASGNVVVFYTIKWHGLPALIYPLSQLTNYSLGIPLAVLAYAGLLYECVKALTPKLGASALVAFFVVSYFISAGMLYMKYLRYMEPIVPALCVLAAIPIMALAGDSKHSKRAVWRVRRWTGYAAGGLVLLLTGCYGLAYQHIYSKPLTYVQASTWIYAHIPGGTRLAENSLDNSLPLGLNAQQDPSIYAWAGASTVPVSGNQFPTYDDDSLAKAQTMAGILSHAQYYLEDGRRAVESFEDYGSKYPYMQRFYKLLLGSALNAQDSLGYTMVAQFVEHPQLGPWTDTEQGVNQNFDEYDHPQIEIFKNTGRLSTDEILAALTDHGRIQDPTLTGAGSTATTLPKSLLLSAKDIQVNQKNPTYAGMFPADSLPMRFPAPVWWLMLEALGLLALPISMRLFGKLGDCGFVVSKTVGILLLAWFAWILASLRIADYSRQEIALCLIPIAAISLAWGPRLPDIPRILRSRWRAIALTEGVFILGFIAFLWIRAVYPDMWHNFDGGEKTMDFSFLNAIVRSRVMPPLDPWFSGGYLNYYYYGHFTVATLLKLAGITPAIAINLALPTFFALTLGTGVSIAYSLVRRIPFALLAGVFSMLLGNLYGAQQMIMDLQASSTMQSQVHPVASAGSDLPVLGPLINLLSWLYSLIGGVLWGAVAAIQGLFRVLLQQASLPSYPFRSWAWDGSRSLDDHRIITEFPFWTFLYGDPHAHLWDMPFALCIVAVAFNFAHGVTGKFEHDDWERPIAVTEVEQSRPMLPGLSLVVWPIIGVLIGAIGPTNPWDMAAMLGIIGIVVVARSFWLGRGWLRTGWSLVWQAGLLAIFAFGLYEPFYSHFQSFYSHIGWTILRHQSPLNDFLSHWGLPIYVLLAYLLYSVYNDTRVAPWLRAHVRGTLFTMYYWERRDALPRYFAMVRRPEPIPVTWRPCRNRPVDVLVIALGGLTLALAAAVLHLLPFAGFALLVATLLIFAGPLRTVVLVGGGTAVVFFFISYGVLALLTAMAGLALLLLIDRRERQEPALMFFHVMIIMGLLVAAAGEIVYVRDFYDGDPILFRSNTVFKLYEDAWLLLNISAAVGLARLLLPFLPKGALTKEVRGASVVEPFGSLAVLSSGRRDRRARRLGLGSWAWLGGLLLLVVAAAIYPLRMTPERLDQRSTAWPALAAAHAGPTLDGMQFLRYAYPDDYAAIEWINRTIPGSPVMLTSRYGGYENFSARVGMFTGLPTVVDWGFEASQQRYNLQTADNGQIYPRQVGDREDAVDEIYSTLDTQAALNLLHTYHVSYVYVGVQERGDPFYPATDPNLFHGYPHDGLAKFDQMVQDHELALVFHHGQPGRPYEVKIYKVM